MADFSVNGRMTVKTLKEQFKSAFGATLRVYNGVKFADEGATLASIRAEGKKGGDFSVHGRTLVGNFENQFLEEMGIKVQVANKDNTALSSNDITLTQAGK